LRVVAYIPDLLFGSGVLSALQNAGHDAVLVGDSRSLAREASRADVLIVDLTAEVSVRLQLVRGQLGAGPRTLAFYSHVETEVRTQALEAGFDQVVARSRMAREGVGLVERLSAGAG
jgi:hypothetical protein